MNEVPVRILNANSFSVNLQRDAVVAESKAVCCITGKDESPSRFCGKCPQQLVELLTSTCDDLD